MPAADVESTVRNAHGWPPSSRPMNAAPTGNSVPPARASATMPNRPRQSDGFSPKQQTSGNPKRSVNPTVYE